MKKITIYKALTLILILLISGFLHLSHAQNGVDSDSPNSKSADYGQVAPLSDKSVQELAERVEQVEWQNEILRDQNMDMHASYARLFSEIEALRSRINAEQLGLKEDKLGMVSKSAVVVD